MNKAQIIAEVDFIIEKGFFKIDDSLRILKFRSDLEDEMADKIMSEKLEPVKPKIESKSPIVPKPKVNPVDDDMPF